VDSRFGSNKRNKEPNLLTMIATSWGWTPILGSMRLGTAPTANGKAMKAAIANDREDVIL